MGKKLKLNVRLEEFRPILEEYARKKWTSSSTKFVSQIVEISSMATSTSISISQRAEEEASTETTGTDSSSVKELIKGEDEDDANTHPDNSNNIPVPAEANGAQDQGDPSSLESAPFAWDNLQGVGFREYPHPIVLIGYTSKCVSVDKIRLHGLCKTAGVMPMPLCSKSREKSALGLFLEDSSARIRLVLASQLGLATKLKFKFETIVSGIPVALKGISSCGKFWVEDVIFATPPPPEIPLSSLTNIPEMIFIYGLSMNNPNTSIPGLDLLKDYLLRVSRSFSRNEENPVGTTTTRPRVFFLGNIFDKRKPWNPLHSEDLIAEQADTAMRLDELFATILATSEVYIIPGENDPTHVLTLPQPAINSQLFPISGKKCRFLTNPAKLHLPLSTSKEDQNCFSNYISIILSSGRNVKQTMEHCDINRPLKMCAKLLEWAHLHPTSTSTSVDGQMAQEIFNLKDPLPHLFLVGGLQASGIVKDFNGTRIVSIPSFASTNTVMVLTENGNVLPISFKVTI